MNDEQVVLTGDVREVLEGDEELRVLMEERQASLDVEAAVATSGSRYMGLNLSPELHRRVLNYAMSLGLQEMLDERGMVHGVSLEGAAIGLIVKRYFDGHHPELGGAR